MSDIHIARSLIRQFNTDDGRLTSSVERDWYDGHLRRRSLGPTDAADHLECYADALEEFYARTKRQPSSTP